jgi:hypothetical protein
MSSMRKEYQVDHHAVKAESFFLVCESHIDPNIRVTIPAAMMAKGYSNKESKNRTLKTQVHQEMEKIRGLDPPPFQGSGRGRDGPVDSFASPRMQ